MLKIIHASYNLFQENTMAVWKDDDKRCAIVDPGFSTEREKEHFHAMLSENGLKPEAILLTHAHADHIFGVKSLQDEFGIPVYMHPEERKILQFNTELCGPFRMPVPDSGFSFTEILDGSVVEIASMRFEVIGTPGHTPGGVCYYERQNETLLSGDTLFAGTIGRSDLKWGEYDDLIRSVMEKLMVLDSRTRVFPGHGPQTSIAREKSTNPFLEPVNGKEEEYPEDLEPISISH